MARYGQVFKDKAVAPLLPPESAAVKVVAREVGVGGTLQRWREDVQPDWKLWSPAYWRA